MDAEERFQNWEKPEMEHGKLTKWNWIVQHPQNIILGKKIDIGTFTYINALHGVEIQDEVQIGSHCSIYSVSTIDDKQGKVTLKRNCRIGTHSSIMPGVTVGENSVIGAYSFVNKDVPDNEVWVGVPARMLKRVELKEELKK